MFFSLCECVCVSVWRLVVAFSDVAGEHNLQLLQVFDVLWRHPLPGTEKIKDGAILSNGALVDCL